jgi:hypothetical protein
VTSSTGAAALLRPSSAAPAAPQNRILTDPGQGVEPVANATGGSTAPFVVESAYKENT